MVKFATTKLNHLGSRGSPKSSFDELFRLDKRFVINQQKKNESLIFSIQRRPYMARPCALRGFFILDDIEVKHDVPNDESDAFLAGVSDLQLRSKIADYFFRANFNKSPLFWVHKTLSR